MNLILSAVAFLFFLIYTIKILSGHTVLSRQVIYNGVYMDYEMNPLMQYLIFIIITGPLLLTPPFTLAKYGVFFVTLLYLIAKHDIIMPSNIVTKSYWLFYIWIAISMLWTSAYYSGTTLLIKYFIPILSLYLGYSAFTSKIDLIIMMKYVIIGCVIYTFIIGGLSAEFYSWLYFSPIGAIFLKYAGFADYLTTLFIMPFLYVWITGNSRFYLASISMVLSTLLDTVRTGLGGMALVTFVYLLFRYKVKSIPYLAVLVGISIATVLFVPEVNQKFFGEKSGKVTANEIITDNAMSLDNIQTSGRSFMWELTANHCYKGHETIGSGLGSASSYLSYLRTKGISVPELLHNDYLQIKCDSGLIGLGLYCLFYAMIIINVVKNVWNTENKLVKVSGIMAVSSFAGMAFSMYFDNVVSHSMSSMIMPFIFLGIYFKSVEINADEQIFE